VPPRTRRLDVSIQNGEVIGAVLTSLRTDDEVTSSAETRNRYSSARRADGIAHADGIFYAAGISWDMRELTYDVLRLQSSGHIDEPTPIRAVHEADVLAESEQGAWVGGGRSMHRCQFEIP